MLWACTACLCLFVPILRILTVTDIIVGVDNMQANTVQHHSTLYSGASEIAAAIGKLASLQLKTLKLLIKS